MNKQNRKKVAELKEQIEAIHGELESLAEAEQEKFDNMPEGLQQGEKGQAIEAAASSLQEAADSINEAITSLEEIE